MPKHSRDRSAGPGLKPSDLTFAQARTILERTTEEAKAELATGSNEPGILAYLSGDLSAEIRGRVAANRATPHAVDLDLSENEDGQVRAELARKIARLIPGLGKREVETLRETSIKVLERLAADSLPRVRQIVAEEIKNARNIPAKIALKLARDAEIVVAAPILQYSPLLSDQDLIEIVATSEVEGVLEAIAKRHDLSAEVSDAIVATLDIPAVAALLANQSADVRAVTLEYIVENAAQVERWHQPLVVRPELSLRAVRRIAGFVASSLLETLASRHGLDDDTKLFLSSRVRERLKTESLTPASEEKAHDRAIAAVAQAMKSGRIEDEFVTAAIENDDRLRVIVALAAITDLPEAHVERILKSGNGPLITAFAWHAGLAMRTAFVLQRDIARLTPRDLVPARNGVDYPYSEDQMRTQLQMVAIAPRAS